MDHQEHNLNYSNKNLRKRGYVNDRTSNVGWSISLELLDTPYFFVFFISGHCQRVFKFVIIEKNSKEQVKKYILDMKCCKKIKKP